MGQGLVSPKEPMWRQSGLTVVVSSVTAGETIGLNAVRIGGLRQAKVRAEADKAFTSLECRSSSQCPFFEKMC